MMRISIKTEARQDQKIKVCSNPSEKERWGPEEPLLEMWEVEAVLVGRGWSSDPPDSETHSRKDI